jgi:hypothetical protein
LTRASAAFTRSVTVDVYDLNNTLLAEETGDVKATRITPDQD